MVGLLKTFGKGFLYVIGLPFFILALAIFAVIGVFLFIFQIVRSIIFFFTGQKFFPELEEDKKLRLMKERASGQFDEDEAKEESNEKESIDSSRDSIIFPYEEEDKAEDDIVEEESSFDTIEKACFDDDREEIIEDKDDEDVLESLVREEPVSKQETIDEPFEPIKEETLETSEKEEPIEEEEELEEYVPKSTSYVADVDDEDTSDGVLIDYDVR